MMCSLTPSLYRSDTQVPSEVYAHLCGSLVRMLHSCLPESFGPAGNVRYTTVDDSGADAPAFPLSSPPNRDGLEAVDEEGKRSPGAHGTEDGNSSVVNGSQREYTMKGGESDEMAATAAPTISPRQSDLRSSSAEASSESPLARGHDSNGGDGNGRTPNLHAQSSQSLGLSLDSEALREDEEHDAKFDGARATALLAAALRLQRLLYGVARLHLGALAEDQARELLSGLSSGLRYARAFQAHHELRMSLLSAG